MKTFNTVKWNSKRKVCDKKKKNLKRTHQISFGGRLNEVVDLNTNYDFVFLKSNPKFTANIFCYRNLDQFKTFINPTVK